MLEDTLVRNIAVGVSNETRCPGMQDFSGRREKRAVARPLKNLPLPVSHGLKPCTQTL